MRFALLVLLTAGPAAAGPPSGVVMRLGPAPPLPELESAGAEAIAAALGLEARGAEPALDAGPAIAAMAAAEAEYWERGDARRAAAALKRARALLPAQVPAAQRPKVLQGLWLLARLSLDERPPRKALADEILDQGIRIDPGAAPRIIVRVDGEVPQTCAAHIDGVESGSVNRALGPFLPGEHRVQLVCGSRSSWVHRIALTGTAVDVLIPAWELELSLTGDGLHLTRPGPLAAIEDRLLSASKIEWVLTATTGLDDRVTCRLRVRGQTDPHLSQQLAPAAVAPWVRGRLRPVVAPLLPAAVATQRARWWHWTLIGLGAALAGGGGAVHYHGELLIQETEDPARMVDRRPEVPAVEAAYISMYVAGAAAIVAGAILASATVGTADGAPKAMLIPAPGSISVHVTF